MVGVLIFIKLYSSKLYSRGTFMFKEEFKKYGSHHGDSQVKDSKTDLEY